VNRNPAYHEEWCTTEANPGCGGPAPVGKWCAVAKERKAAQFREMLPRLADAIVFPDDPGRVTAIHDGGRWLWGIIPGSLEVGDERVVFEIEWERQAPADNPRAAAGGGHQGGHQRGQLTAAGRRMNARVLEKLLRLAKWRVTGQAAPGRAPG
jgi:hypothetical protein